MRVTNLCMILILLLAVFQSCEKKEDLPPEPQETEKPIIREIETSSSGGPKAVIGGDFYFNTEVFAENKIDVVQLKIAPAQGAGARRAESWSFEKTWEQYRGLTDTQVQEHIKIPTEATEGTYDLSLIVKDQKEGVTEQKSKIQISSSGDMLANPHMIMVLMKKDARGVFYGDSEIKTNNVLTPQDTLVGYLELRKVAGNGKLVSFLVNKKHNHRPLSMDKIDYDKVIVYNISEHKGFQSPAIYIPRNNVDYRIWYLKIGSENDLNTPPKKITGNRAWETGDYYFGAIYQNSSGDITACRYADVVIKMN